MIKHHPYIAFNFFLKLCWFVIIMGYQKKEILHVNMMLECNLKLLVKCFCLQIPAKTLSHIMHGTILYGVAQGLHMYCYRLGCLWAGAK